MRATTFFVVFKFDGVELIGCEIDSGAIFCGTVISPVVDEQLIIDPESDAIIRNGVEGVGTAGGRKDAAAPAGAVVVVINDVWSG